MKKWLSLLLSALMLFAATAGTTYATEDTLVNYIGNEQFNYQNLDELVAADGVTVLNTDGGTQLADVTVANGQLVMSRIDGSAPAMVTKLLNEDPGAYLSGQYRGAFEFTQTGGNVYLRLRSTQAANPVFTIDLASNGAMFVNWGGGNAVFRGDDWAKNKNGTFRVEFTVDRDSETISIWMVDLRDPSTAAWVCENQPFQDNVANGKNCVGLDFILKSGSKGSGGSLDYFKLAHAEDYDVLRAADQLTESSVLNGNKTANTVRTDLALPVSGDNGETLLWESSNPAVIAENGVVTQDKQSRNVTLTAKVSKDGKYALKTLNFTVLGVGEADPDIILYEFDGTSALPSGVVLDTEEKNLYGVSGKVTISGNAPSRFNSAKLSASGVDITGYEWLNFWIHSSGQYGTQQVSPKLEDINGKLADYMVDGVQSGVLIDWADSPGEWRLISLPLSEFQSRSTPVIMTNITNMRMVFGGNGGVYQNGAVMNFDKCWLSVEKPKQQEVLRREASYIGSEPFDYENAQALLAGPGITVANDVNGKTTATVSAEDSHAVLTHTADGTEGDATLTKLFSEDASAYNSKLQLGRFEFTQVNGGNAYIRVRSADSPQPVFSVEIKEDGDFYVNWGGGGARYREGDPVRNKNGTFLVEYLVNKATDRVSIWVADAKDPSSRVQLCDMQPFQSSLATGKNCVGVDFILKAGAEGSGMQINYAKLAYRDDLYVMSVAEELTMAYILGENTSASAVKTDLNLPNGGADGTIIRWESSDPSLISTNGTVTVPDEPTNVILTATIVKNGTYKTLSYPLVVASRALTDAELVALAKDLLTENDLLYEGQDKDALVSDLKLPPSRLGDVIVNWESSRPDLITAEGVVMRGEETAAVTLTATLSKGNASDTKSFTFTVEAREKGVIFERTFESGDLSDWIFADTNGETSTHEVADNQLTITKTSPAVPASAASLEAIDAKLPLKAVIEPFDDETKTAVYSTAVDGTYELEVQITPYNTAEFGIVTPLGSNTMLPGTTRCGHIFFKKGVVQAYIIQSNKGYYYDLLSENTLGKTYVVKFKIDTNAKTFWTYLNGNQVGDPDGYPIDSTVNFLTGIEFVMKSKGNKGDYIKLDYIKLKELSANENTSTRAIADAMAALPISALSDTPSAVTEDLNQLPKTVETAQVKWTSSRPELIADDGILLRRPVASDERVILTAAFTNGSYTRYKEYYLTVKADPTVRGKLADAAAAVQLADLTDEPADAVTKSLKPLPSSGLHGSTITWTSDNPQYIGNDGVFYKRDSYKDTVVNMKAVFSLEGEQYEKIFALKIPLDILSGMYTLYQADFSALPTDNWGYSQTGGGVTAKDGSLVLKKSGSAGAVQAKADFVRNGAETLSVTKPMEIETVLSVGDVCKKGNYTIYASNGAPALNVIFEYDESAGKPIYYMMYNDNDAPDRGAGYATTAYTERTDLPEGSRLKVRALIYPDTNRMSVWVDDALIIDNQFTRKAVKDVQYALYAVEDKDGNLGRMTVDSFRVNMNKGQVLDLLLENILFNSGVKDGALITKSVDLRSMKLLGTTSVWTSSRPDIIGPDGTFHKPKESTPVTLTLRISHDDDSSVFAERSYHVTAVSLEEGNLALGKTVTTNAPGSAMNGAENAIDGLMDTAWRTMGAEKTPALTVDLGEETYVDGFALYESDNNGVYPVRGYRLEGSLDNNRWFTLYSGGSVGAETGVIQFKMERVRYVRYSVTDKLDGNSGLKEFELFFRPSDEDRVRAELDLLTIDAPYRLTQSIKLPAFGPYGSSVTYIASNPSVLSESGIVNRPKEDTKVTLTPVISGIKGAARQFVVEGTGYGGGSSGGSSGGGGGTGSGNGTSVAFPSTDVTNDPNTETSVFTDLPAAHWAADYVKKLKERNIVSGDDEGKFHPEREITREEFLKILLGAFDITPLGTETGFDDVEPDAWYAPYVAEAVRLGIINGISETEFGAGRPITREDIAVMCDRLLKQSGRTLETADAVAFTDHADIASYAAEAVNNMQRYGILGGFEDGSFRPRNNATRAETAKIISKLL